jgi:hypothetical protein
MWVKGASSLLSLKVAVTDSDQKSSPHVLIDMFRVQSHILIHIYIQRICQATSISILLKIMEKTGRLYFTIPREESQEKRLKMKGT